MTVLIWKYLDFQDNLGRIRSVTEQFQREGGLSRFSTEGQPLKIRQSLIKLAKKPNQSQRNLKKTLGHRSSQPSMKEQPSPLSESFSEPWMAKVSPLISHPYLWSEEQSGRSWRECRNHDLILPEAFLLSTPPWSYRCRKTGSCASKNQEQAAWTHTSHVTNLRGPNRRTHKTHHRD